jgi:hypothetical protein
VARARRVEARITEIKEEKKKKDTNSNQTFGLHEDTDMLINYSTGGVIVLIRAIGLGGTVPAA